MSQQEFCKGCNQKHDCQRIYRQLADTKQPVILKVIVAFLLPIVVFIACLAIFETIPAQASMAKEQHTGLVFLLALLTTLCVILAIKAVERRVGKNK